MNRKTRKLVEGFIFGYTITSAIAWNIAIVCLAFYAALNPLNAHAYDQYGYGQYEYEYDSGCGDQCGYDMETDMYRRQTERMFDEMAREEQQEQLDEMDYKLDQLIKSLRR